MYPLIRNERVADSIATGSTLSARLVLVGGAGAELVAPLSHRRPSLRRCARDAQRQFNRVRHLFFHLPRHDAEVAALDTEVGADDQQVDFLVRDALARGCMADVRRRRLILSLGGCRVFGI